jgi:hypothetical protein
LVPQQHPHAAAVEVARRLPLLDDEQIVTLDPRRLHVLRSAPSFNAKPYVPNNAALAADSRTTSAAATVGSTFGTIVSGWQLATDGSLTMSVTLPVGTTATVDVPSLGGTANTVLVSYGSVKEQTITGTLANGYIQLQGVPSGQYTFKRAAP